MLLSKLLNHFNVIIKSNYLLALILVVAIVLLILGIRGVIYDIKFNYEILCAPYDRNIYKGINKKEFEGTKDLTFSDIIKELLLIVLFVFVITESAIVLFNCFF